jgi:hypothetical protein
MIRTVPYTAEWRWRVLHAPTDEPFAINGHGLCEFSEPDWPGRGVFFPLGPSVGLLGFLHLAERHRRRFRRLDFADHRTLNPGYATLLNVNMWEDANYFLVARYDQRTALEQLPDEETLRFSTRKPYRLYGHGFFAD